MSHEDGSFICIMEGGNAYGHILADVSGRLNDYNNAYAEYDVLHYDTLDTTRSPQLMQMYEGQIPEDTVVQRYRFVDEPGYVEMAKAYSEYLKSNDGMKASVTDGSMPVNIELVGAIDKKVVKMGIPVESFVPVTTFEDAEGIISDLADREILNLSVRYTGWSNGGVRQKVLTSVHTLNELGGDKMMKELIAEAKDRNVDLYFDGISCFAYNSGVAEGFIPYEHASRSTNREICKRYPYSIVNYTQSDWMEAYYLVRPKYASQYASNLIKALSDRNAAGVAFRDIGNLLNADYYDRDTVTREQVKQMNRDTLAEADAAGLKISVKEGNEYALQYADLITDMDLMGSSYAILDEKVPFYQIAIHGLKNYTGQAINLAGDYQTALLECAAYGAGLNFTFMYADTRVLQDSYYSCYASAGYGPWKEQVLGMIERYQREMDGLNNQSITDFENLIKDVSVTTYADGTRVYVNYSDKDYSANSVVVPARDYVVKRGDGQ